MFVVVVVVCMYFPLLPSIFTKANQKIKKREKAEPQGQALAKRTCRGGRNEQKKMLLVRRGAQCIYVCKSMHIRICKSLLGYFLTYLQACCLDGALGISAKRKGDFQNESFRLSVCLFH